MWRVGKRPLFVRCSENCVGRLKRRNDNAVQRQADGGRAAGADAEGRALIGLRFGMIVIGG